MTKICCNIEDMKSISNKIISAGEELNSKAKKCNEEAKNNLTKWSGSDKDNYSKEFDDKINTILNQAQSLENLGKYLKNYGDNILDLENNLSKIKI